MTDTGDDHGRRDIFDRESGDKFDDESGDKFSDEISSGLRQAELVFPERHSVDEDLDRMLAAVIFASGDFLETVAAIDFETAFGTEVPRAEFEDLERLPTVRLHVMNGIIDHQFLLFRGQRNDLE